MLLTLASTAGTALVNAMVTDGWEGVRAKFARLLGRGDAKETDAAAARLERSRDTLAALAGTELDRARAGEAIAWRTRFADFLDRYPGAEAELRSLVAELPASGTVVQHAVARDNAQQAIQGHGVQHNVFGGQGGTAGA
jgi:hypothetical protein